MFALVFPVVRWRCMRHWLMKTEQRRARQGFTLTEIAIVLGISGLTLGAIWVAFGSSSNSQKAAQASSQVLTIVNGYRQIYGARGVDDPTIWDDITCLGVNFGAFPSDMLSATPCSSGPGNIGYPQTPWGGGTFVEVQAYQPNQMVHVIYANLTSAQCISFGDAVLANAANNGMIYEAGIYNGVWTAKYLPPMGTDTPWAISDIPAICASASNTVGGGFSVR